MEQIIEPGVDFDFSKIICTPPNSIGGSYFTKLFYNNKPIYIQTPKSLTKQGIIQGKKINYTDLMFNNEDTIFVQWIENLEERCQELIYQNGEKWFENKLEKSDIETAFSSTMKIFKSGKYYLIRTNVKSNVKIYSESNEYLEQTNLQSSQHLISILEIQGIKFTSRNFQIIIEMKQGMVVSPDPFLEECFIQKPFKPKSKMDVKVSNDFDLEKETRQISEPTKSTLYKHKVEMDKKKEDTLEEYDPIQKYDMTEEMEENEEIEEIEEKEENREKEGIEQSEEIEENEQNEENINLDIEDLRDNFPEEIELEIPYGDQREPITLKNPKQVYYDLYKKAREKAKQAKKVAMSSYLEAKDIQNAYLLDELNESDSDLEINISNLG